MAKIVVYFNLKDEHQFILYKIIMEGCKITGMSPSQEIKDIINDFAFYSIEDMERRKAEGTVEEEENGK